MDGVIIDSHPAHRKAWREFLQSLGRQVADSDLDYILDGRKRADILSHFLGPLSTEQIIEYGKCKDLFFRESSSAIEPIPGAVQFVKHVAAEGIRMAVATSASEDRTSCTLEHLQLKRYFATVVTGRDVTAGKPKPDIYLAACKLLKVDPLETVAFEDAVSGVVAAKSAGLRCVGVLSHETSDKLTAAGADFTISDFNGLSLSLLELGLAESLAYHQVAAFSSEDNLEIDR